MPEAAKRRFEKPCGFRNLAASLCRSLRAERFLGIKPLRTRTHRHVNPNYSDQGRGVLHPPSATTARDPHSLPSATFTSSRLWNGLGVNVNPAGGTACAGRASSSSAARRMRFPRFHMEAPSAPGLLRRDTLCTAE